MQEQKPQEEFVHGDHFPISDAANVFHKEEKVHHCYLHALFGDENDIYPNQIFAQENKALMNYHSLIMD